MELLFGFTESALEALTSELIQSPENFLEGLEHLVDTGVLTLEEAAQIMSDYATRSR